jgi:aminomethyltransferase
LNAGDTAWVEDPEGLQAADVFVFGDDGVRPLLAGVPAAPHPEMPEAARAVLAAITGVDPARGVAYRVLAVEGGPGRRVAIVPNAACWAVLCAPGQPMAPDQQAAPTTLRLTLPEAAGAPPAPLAPAKMDLRVPAATAAAYRVAAGDYIQIVDIDGQQCSDFLAFDAAALAAGRERSIDATTTRTLMGHSTPAPGLHAKYFDAEMQPLVEVIQDTVGRHDAFLLACTAKYYADMGYPGHANCSDNFSAALKEFGLPARPGWPAINFFFNTAVAADGSILSDAPWSRPGDYVLLRALTDLVCASSSCADDIDPANAWVPTDIQVRIYDKGCSFPRGIAHRMTPQATPEMTRQTGFHSRTAALARRMVEYKGFWLPESYTAYGPLAEYWACRERAVVMDLSALRKVEITGPDAEALLQLAVTRDVRKLAVGQVVYTALCHPSGGMIDDATIFRLGPQNFRFVCGDPFCAMWLRQLAEERNFSAWCRTSTDQLHNLAVQGPRSREILAGIVQTPAHQPALSELGWFRFTIGRIGDVPVVVSRTGYTGELGYEIWCHPDDCVPVWDAVWAAGGAHGLAPMGLAALDMLRIEAGLVFAGAEFCDQTDPFEAGIGFTVPLNKPDAYIGAEALARRRAHPQRRLVGLTIASQETVGHGDPLFAGRAQVGVVTSATKSPILRMHIALARVDVGSAAPGQTLSVGKLDGRQKRLSAFVTPFPHYDAQKLRVRA